MTQQTTSTTKTASKSKTANVKNKSLFSALMSLNTHLGYTTIQWFEWFLDDCLGSFGRKITNPPPQECIPDLFELGGIYANEVIKAEPFHDILGHVYQELSTHIGKKALGQFFTPHAVARLIASTQIHGITTHEKNLTTVCEPCVGSGVMLLSFIQEWLDAGRPLNRLGLYAVDLDRICTRMVTLQIMANCLIYQHTLGELQVYQGNGLAEPSSWDLVYWVRDKNREADDFPDSQSMVRDLYMQQKARFDEPYEPQLQLFVEP